MLSAAQFAPLPQQLNQKKNKESKVLLKVNSFNAMSILIYAIDHMGILIISRFSNYLITLFMNSRFLKDEK